MAVVKACKGGRSLGSAIRYAAKENITLGKDCSDDPLKVLEEMRATKEIWDQMDGRQYKHYVIAFAPGEASVEQALTIADKFMDKNFPGHESFAGVHTDKNHLHIHIIANSVNFENGKKIHLDDNDLERFKSISDQLCTEQGLSVIDRSKPRAEGQERFYNMSEYQLNKKGESHASKMKESIIAALGQSRGQGIEAFKENLKNQGISIDLDRSKNDISFRNENIPPIQTPNGRKNNKKKSTRASTLAEKTGDEMFTRENIVDIVINGKEFPALRQFEINKKLTNIVKERTEQGKPPNPVESKYITYTRKGLDDKQSAIVMLKKDKIDKNLVGRAIASYSPSPSCPSRSDEAKTWAGSIVSAALKADRTAVGVALKLGSDDDDLSCLDGEALQEAIKAKGNGVGIA